MLRNEVGYIEAAISDTLIILRFVLIPEERHEVNKYIDNRIITSSITQPQFLRTKQVAWPTFPGNGPQGSAIPYECQTRQVHHLEEEGSYLRA